jgi:putative oxidoreductase
MKIAFEINPKLVLRWLLAGLLVWAALSKIANVNEFYLNMALYRLPLPDAWLRLAAMVMPWLELLAGILMIGGTARQAALFWAMVLFATFVLATGQAWVRGLNISCGCFNLDFLGAEFAGFFETVKFAFFRALLLFGASVYLWRSRADPAKPELAG